MKMIMISYNEAVNTDVMEALESCGIKNYTKIMGVYGRGEKSGTHLGNDIWPGRNNVLYVACGDAEAKKVMQRVSELRKGLGREGIKAFLMPVEELT